MITTESAFETVLFNMCENIDIIIAPLGGTIFI
jgi:hypothetical protein